MVKDSEKDRLSDPTYAKWLLDAINKVKHQKQRPNFTRICNAVRQFHQVSQESIAEQLELTVQDGLILKVASKDGNWTYRDPSGVTPCKNRSLKVTHNMDLTKIIVKTIKELADPQGSNLKKIKSYIISTYNLDVEEGVELGEQLKVSLKKGVASGHLVRDGHCIKVGNKGLDESTASSSTSGSYDEDSASDLSFCFEQKTKCAKPVLICCFCLGDENKNREGVPEDLISCAECGNSGHPSCLKFSPELTETVKKLRWQCIDCKTCSFCQKSGREDNMLFCDLCDRGFHMECCDPPLSKAPKGKWKCNICDPDRGNGKGRHFLEMAAKLAKKHKPNKSHHKDKNDAAKCPTPGCDGTGNVNSKSAYHRTQLACPKLTAQQRKICRIQKKYRNNKNGDVSESDEETGNVHKSNSRPTKEHPSSADGSNDSSDEDVSHTFEPFFNIDKPKGLVDGLSKFFTPTNKRTSRVSLNSYNADLAAIPKHKKMNDQTKSNSQQAANRLIKRSKYLQANKARRKCIEPPGSGQLKGLFDGLSHLYTAQGDRTKSHEQLNHDASKKNSKYDFIPVIDETMFTSVKDKLAESDDSSISSSSAGSSSETSSEDEQENSFATPSISNSNSFLTGKHKGFVKRRGAGRGKKPLSERQVGVGRVVKRGFGRGPGRPPWKHLIGSVYLGRERVIDKNGITNHKFNKGHGLKGGKGFSHGNVSEKNGSIKNFFSPKSASTPSPRGRGRGAVSHKNSLADRSAHTTPKGRGRGAAAGKRPSSVSSHSSDNSDDEEEEEEEEEESDDEEDEEEEEILDDDEKEDIGLEFLTKKDDDSKSLGDFDQDGPGKNITDIAAQAQSLQPKGYTLETTTVKTAVPFLLKHSLREYQHVGLDWLATMYEQRLNGILADEMGLGKTIQTIALLAHLACEKSIWGPHLIVVPTSVMLNWEMEIKKWCPAFKILTYYGTLKERKLKRQGWTKTNAFHICITSYKLVIQDHQSFRRKKWKYFILDEAQNIKNFKSQRWQTLLNFQSQRRLLLTGTPLQNSLMELWSLMHFLMPHVFQSHREFKEWFANPLTGMIEGSHEYNESLIKRLHKVLRPFLLRRLKQDVEKQMPKKYEHVVMCHLSKRQRYLYDDFMSQTKTKETLATGHFMSVINILMQLRKVCNHPSLFDPRPIVSPFKTEGINYCVPSLVLNCLNYNPFKEIDLHSLYPCLAEMELNLPAFVAHRMKKLQAKKTLIEEIHGQPEDYSRPPSGKLKQVVLKTGRASPSATGSPVSLVQTSLKAETANGVPIKNIQTPGPCALPATSSHSTSKVQAQTVGQTGIQQPLTVHIQQTDQGARLMIPAGQLSQLPAGFIQIVQTSTGQQIIATSSPMSTSSKILASIPTSSVQALSVTTNTTSSYVVNGPPIITTVASSTSSTLVTNVNAQVKTTPAVQLPSSTSSGVASRPVMRVSPLSSQAPNPTTKDSTVSKLSRAEVTTTTMSLGSKTSELLCDDVHNKSSPFYMESLTSKLQKLREQKLDFLAKINKRRCECMPVYGEDLCNAVDVFKNMIKTSVKDNTWKGLGMAYCHNVKSWRNPNHPDIYWKQTTVLSELVHSPMDFLRQMNDILSRFVFVTPLIVSPQIQLHASHPSPSYLSEQRRTEFCLRQHISPKTDSLHLISSKMTVQFPELRLIQYDCGKLQVMDILLRQLKSGSHRVLIFTQMTKMLNILEAFLNYHGHRYLRLDGTTKVEQRQFLMERFNADKRIFAFILSTRSGGIGVNLTGADTVIFYDSDWNPTMDAQAQDRCHRIGQTRDVHIYRLISERTVEENILKKANQKRMLGDMAIEGGNFTTAFFKEQTIQELFTEPSGLESLADEISKKEKLKEEVTEKSEETNAGGDAGEEYRVQSEKNIMAQFEKVLAKAEDETDAQATDLVKAEQKAELAEFDEDIPWDEREAELKKEEELSKVEQEIAMLDKELTPVERYAVNFIELEIDPMEELEIGEDDIEIVKKDWELGRLKALKEEEERRAELEEDEMLYIYSRDDAYNQVFLSDIDQEKMPMWAPPTPPHDDNDIYIDQSLLFLYEPNVMPETQLPPVYIKKEHKKPKIESITTRQKKQRKEEQTRVPRSLFDRPTAQLLKIRREHKQKSGLLKPFRPVPPPIVKPNADTSDHPEWLIHEDWALLQAVQSLFDVPLNLMVVSPAHHPNWDLVADVVNTCSRVYRSAKQCKNRYENVIIPREEGRILYDINPRKQSKKTKGIYKTKNNRPMRTSQLHIQDNSQAVTMLYSFRFESAKQIAAKRPPPLKQTLVNPTLKNPKHATVLSENNINYDQPLNPMSVAEIRAQRIQREKKQNQAAAQATADQQLAVQRTGAQGTATTGTTVVHQTTPSMTVTSVTQPVQTAVVSSTVLTGVVQKAAIGQVSVSLPRTASGNIVVNTQGGVPTNFAAINRRMSQQATSIAQPATVTVAGSLTPANIRTQRTAAPLTIQEITAIASQPQVTTSISTGQQVARTQLQTTVTGAQLAAVQRASTGQQLTQQTVTRNLTPQQLQQLQQRQQTLINQQKSQQQLRMQKLNLTQQQLKQLQQQQQGRGPKVIASGLVGQLTSIPAQHIAQSASVAGTSGTQLVKTVSAPVGGVQIPVSTVNINVSVPQQKGVIGKAASVSQLPQAKIQHIQQIQQIRQQQGIKQPQKITSVGQQVGKGQSFPLNAVQIIQQPASGSGGRHLTYSLQQFMQQNKGSGMIITSQPIITTVTQSQQPQGQMVTKVLGSSAVPTTHLQTLSATPISVTHVSAVQSSNVTAQPTASTISITGVGNQAGKPLTVTTVTQDGSTGTTIQVQPSPSATQLGSQTTTQQLIPQQVVQQVSVTSHTPQKILTQTAHQIQVTPGTIQQVQSGNIAQVVSATPTAVTVTITPAAQSNLSTGTLLQQPVVVTQATTQPSTVTSQAALAAAAALPTTTIAVATAVQSLSQPQQNTPCAAKPSAPYAMRTRNHPKT